MPRYSAGNSTGNSCGAGVAWAFFVLRLPLPLLRREWPENMEKVSELLSPRSVCLSLREDEVSSDLYVLRSLPRRPVPVALSPDALLSVEVLETTGAAGSGVSETMRAGR